MRQNPYSLASCQLDLETGYWNVIEAVVVKKAGTDENTGSSKEYCFSRILEFKRGSEIPLHTFIVY